VKKDDHGSVDRRSLYGLKGEKRRRSREDVQEREEMATYEEKGAVEEKGVEPCPILWRISSYSHLTKT